MICLDIPNEFEFMDAMRAPAGEEGVTALAVIPFSQGEKEGPARKRGRMRG